MFCGDYVFECECIRVFMSIHYIRSDIMSDSNIYLLTGERNILIDSGTGYGSASVMDQIDSILKGDPLDTLILTHCHADHAGGAKQLIDKYGCTCMAYENDAVHLQDADEVVLYEMFGITPIPLDPLELYDGDCISNGQHSLNVIWTPGHTDGSICLYDENTKSLFSGDTVFANGVGRTDFPAGSSVDLKSSIERISSIDIIDLYPGHGNPVIGSGLQSIKSAMRLVRCSYEDN